MPEAEAVNAVFLGQRLQLAVVIAKTRIAFTVMLGQQQVYNVPPRLADPARMGFNGDGLGNWISTTRLKRPLPLNLDHADPAHAGYAQIVVMAQGRNVYANLPGGFQNRRANGYLDRVIVYINAYRRSNVIDAAGRGRPPAIAGWQERDRIRRITVFLSFMIYSPCCDRRASPIEISSWKYLMMERNALGTGLSQTALG